MLFSESDEMSISEKESEETEIEMDMDCQSSRFNFLTTRKNQI